MKLARAARKANGGKRIAPLTPGVALKYPLSGLVQCGQCGQCGRLMTARSGGPYKIKGGDKRVYVYYACPQNCSGACSNGVKILEEWLRDTVLDLVRQRLFPGLAGGGPPREHGTAASENIERLPWLGEVIRDVQAHLDRRPQLDDRRPALDREAQDLAGQMAEWAQSLGQPDLSLAVRATLEGALGRAVERRAAIEQELA